MTRSVIPVKTGIQRIDSRLLTSGMTSRGHCGNDIKGGENLNG